MKMKNKIIVSFSGGKDSEAAVIETMKRFPKKDIQLVFIDTGAEYAGTLEFVENFAGLLELPLTVIRYKRDWYEQIEADKMPFTKPLRKCTHRLKLDVIRSWLSKNKLVGPDVILVTGIRGDESNSRSLLPEEDIDERGRKLWRPVLYRSADDVKDMVRAEGLPLHYCYDFSTRCNCWACIFAGYNEIRTYAEMHPEEWEKACLLEEKIKKPLLGQHNYISDLMKQGRLF